jgi:hypothetical protein
MTGYYDYVLALVPTALFGITGSLFAVGATLPIAVLAGAGVAMAAMGHAMFVNTPVTPAAEPVDAPGRVTTSPDPAAEAAPGVVAADD